MAGEVEQRAIVDDEAVGILADDRGLHPVVEDLARHAADRLERRDVAAQDASAGPDARRSAPRSAVSSRAPARTARRSA